MEVYGILSRLKDEVDACYRACDSHHDSYTDEGYDDEALVELGKMRAYANISDYIESLMLKYEQ